MGQGNQGNRTIYVRRFDTSAVCEVSEDFVLPDYIPEVRRVIGVRAAVTTDGKYLSGDELEADGSVTYSVLYMGGDGTDGAVGTVTMTSQTSAYTGRIPLKSEDDRFTPQDIVLTCTAENVNCRVTAPRKLTLSSKVRMKILSQKPADAGLRADAELSVRRRTEKKPCAAMSEVRQSGECSGEIRERAGMRLICAYGEVCFSDVRVTGGITANVTGDAYVTAVLQSPEGSYVTAKSRVPVEESIPLSQVQQLPDGGSGYEWRSAAFGEVVLLEMQSDDDGVLTWRMEYDADCVLLRCGTAEIVTDAYLTDSAEVLETAAYDAVSPACAVNARLTTQASVKLKPGMVCVCAWGRGTAERLDLTGGRAAITGNAVISVVEAGGGEAVLDEVTVPFRCECEAISPKTADHACISAKTAVRVTDIQLRTDGDTLAVTAELSVSAAALLSETVRCAVSVTPSPTPAVRPSPNLIRVYLPDPTETPWDIAKKFRLPHDVHPADGGIYVI